jgi:hypothetical protein
MPTFPTAAPKHFQPYLRPIDWVYTAVWNALELPVTQVKGAYSDCKRAQLKKSPVKEAYSGCKRALFEKSPVKEAYSDQQGGSPGLMYPSSWIAISTGSSKLDIFCLLAFISCV